MSSLGGASVLPVFVKNTFLDTEDDSMQVDPRRCASEPPRHRHYGAAELPKLITCMDITSDVSDSTEYGSPRASITNDSGSEEGSHMGSECGDISCPTSPLKFGETCKPHLYHSLTKLGNVSSMSQAGLRQCNTNFDKPISVSIFDALRACSQQVVTLQSKRDCIMTSGTSALEHEVDGTCSVEFQTRYQPQAATSQGVGRSNEYTNCPLKFQKGNAAPRTLMICNLPCRIVYDDLIKAIGSIGFADAFEFVHLACRYKQPDSNLGYAFINFFSPADAARFASAFEGYQFRGKGSTKACTVKVAKTQGFNGSYRRMQRLRAAQSQ